MLAHRKYRASMDFDPEGFLMPAYKITSPLVIGFFSAIYLSLFFTGSNAIWPAIGGLVWTVGFMAIIKLSTRNSAVSIDVND